MSAGETSGDFGLVVRFTARPERAEEAGELLRRIDALLREAPGCRYHLVARDRADPACFWVIEAFADRDAHAAAVGRPEVRELAGRLRALLAAEPERHPTSPQAPDEP